MRKMKEILGIRKSTSYYAVLFMCAGLVFGIGSLVVTGGPLVPSSHEAPLHNNPAYVVHESGPDLHEQTPLGDIALGNPALAHVPTGPPEDTVTAQHARWYCGHATASGTYSGVIHKMVFIKHVNGYKHKWKTAHYRWSGTGYVRSSQWWYSTTRCHF
jgi:hypothetical protein